MNHQDPQDSLTLSQDAHASEHVQSNSMSRQLHQKWTLRAGATPSLPVEDIIALNEVNADYANRAIAMAEKEQDFRHSFTVMRETNVARERILGLKLATLVSCFGIIVCAILAYVDHPWVASIFGMSSILGIVTVIVQSSHEESGSQKKKGAQDQTKKKTDTGPQK